MAGRSTPRGRPSTKMAPAMTAPELPAETMPQAFPGRDQVEADADRVVLLAAHGLAGVIVEVDHLGGVLDVDGQGPGGVAARQLVAHHGLGPHQR